VDVAVRVTRLALRDFRSYEQVELDLGASLTVIHGHNGAGKTNLIEGLYFACTGRSCRTTNERDVVRFGASSTRAVVLATDQVGEVELSVGFEPGQPKRMRANGASVDALIEVERRPLLSVFLPDRLELVKGPPALRRSHLDQFVSALWPVRSATRRAYAQTLAQRNALLARIRSGRSDPAALDPWDAQLAEHGIALRDNRAEATALIDDQFASLAGDLGLAGEAELRYRPRSRAASARELAEELAERRASDLERGFTGHGPHRDDLALLRDTRELRAFGSQGEQRLALLALLMAERGAIASARSHPPLMLLDDVMSELDRDRRELLARLLAGTGQSVVTTTDLSHVPGATGPGVSRVAVSSGAVLREVQAA
jgi:DNA replication and repair protein RecF